MLHPRLTPIGFSPGSTASQFLATIGTYGSWSDLQVTTRWGEGASGMYEAQWTMPLPADFDHPLLRRGTLVELMNGAYRVGSPLVLSEPARGTGLDDPWQFVAAGIGREVEGENSWYAIAGTGEATAVPSTAIDRLIADGWPIAGRDASVPTTAIGGSTTTDELMSVGSLLNAADDATGKRHYVDQANMLRFASDPTTPTYQITPNVVSLGSADDGYASVVWGRYLDAATGVYATVYAQNTQTQQKFGRKEYPVNLIPLGAISQATAQANVDSILARTKGRLSWTNGITVTSNEILTMGGGSAPLLKVLDDVGAGCMVRIHGIYSDLLEYNGQTWLDIIIGEAKLTDGAGAIDLAPLGLAARDLARIVEEVTGMASAA